MDRGFLNNRADMAKARARQALQQRRERGETPPAAATQAQTAGASDQATTNYTPSETMNRSGGAYGMYAFPERVRLRPHASMDGGWCRALPDPPEGPSTPTWQEGTISDLNLQMFIEWVHAHPAEALEVFGQMWIIQHRHLLRGPAASGIQPVVWVTPPALQALHRFPCVANNCARCSTGRGGYQFYWCDRRWTPRLCLPMRDLDMDPDSRRCWVQRAAFPYGTAIPSNGITFPDLSEGDHYHDPVEES